MTGTTVINRMIIVNCIGGLGNQMFQYALGRALSLRRKVPFCLDAADFDWYELREYQLEKFFSLKAALASPSEVRKVLGFRALPWARKLLLKKRFQAFRGKKLIIEPQIAYWPPVLEAPEDCYLIGHWFSEKYFKDFEDVIRADFSFKTPLSGLNAELGAQARASASVSVHVRRGDMANDPATLAVHGVCSPGYYRAAAAHIAKSVENPEFFVFSDDIQWAKENIALGPRCRYIDHNKGEDAHNDMRLMSLCRHHIVANSSFSWWGAWLNPDPRKIVVAPERWFAADWDSSDIVPQCWTRIPDPEAGGHSAN